VVVQVLEDRAGEDDAEPTADSEQPRDERDAARDPFAGELVADDAEPEREDSAPQTLDDAPGDHHRKRGCESGDRRPAGETDEHDEQHPLLAEHVPKAPGDRRRDRGSEQVRREDPRDTGGRRMQILLQRRQGRHDEGLEHRVRAAADSEHCEHESGTWRRPGGNLRSHPANLPAAGGTACTQRRRIDARPAPTRFSAGSQLACP